MYIRILWAEAVFFDANAPISIFAAAAGGGKDLPALFYANITAVLTGNVIMEGKIISKAAVIQFQAIKRSGKGRTDKKTAIDDLYAQDVAEEPVQIYAGAAGKDPPFAFHLNGTGAEFLEIFLIVISVDEIAV